MTWSSAKAPIYINLLHRFYTCNLIQKVDRPNTTPIGQDKDILTIQKVDRPNTTPICQDKNILTFKALLERVRLLKTSLFCMKAVEGLYRSLLVEAGFLLNAIYS